MLFTLSFLWRIVILIFNRNKHEKLEIYHEVFFYWFKVNLVPRAFPIGFKVLIVRIEVRLASINLTFFLVLCESTNHSPPLLPTVAHACTHNVLYALYRK